MAAYLLCLPFISCKPLQSSTCFALFLSKLTRMPQAQKASGSGKRKARDSSDPPTPVAKKTKTATARKSTGGHAPPPLARRNIARTADSVSYSCEIEVLLVSMEFHRRRWRATQETPPLPAWDGGTKGNPEIPEEYRSSSAETTFFANSTYSSHLMQLHTHTGIQG